jgi:hypothetical protein
MQLSGHGGIGVAVGPLVAAVEWLAFWSVVVAPAVYVALFATVVPVTPWSLSVALGLHAVALVVGHGHAVELETGER